MVWVLMLLMASSVKTSKHKNWGARVVHFQKESLIMVGNSYVHLGKDHFHQDSALPWVWLGEWGKEHLVLISFASSCNSFLSLIYWVLNVIKEPWEESEFPINTSSIQLRCHSHRILINIVSCHRHHISESQSECSWGKVKVTGVSHWGFLQSSIWRAVKNWEQICCSKRVTQREKWFQGEILKEAVRMWG